MGKPEKRIGEGKAGPGRKKGVPNKTTRVLKEAILLAAENHGADGKGAGGLEGYLRNVAAEDMRAFCSLLGRVLPLQVQGDPDQPLAVTITTVYDAPPT